MKENVCLLIQNNRISFLGSCQICGVSVIFPSKLGSVGQSISLQFFPNFSLAIMIIHSVKSPKHNELSCSFRSAYSFNTFKYFNPLSANVEYSYTPIFNLKS